MNGLDAQYYNSSSMWIIYTIPEVLKAVNNTCYAEKKIVLKVIMPRWPEITDIIKSGSHLRKNQGFSSSEICE